jgi:ABC-type multidrug transport system fused ATPase/permease subunit
LHGISTKINAGDCVAFVGASGSGKSTIIKLIERFYDVGDGFIEINGENIKNIS